MKYSYMLEAMPTEGDIEFQDKLLKAIEHLTMNIQYLQGLLWFIIIIVVVWVLIKFFNIFF